MPTAVLEIAAPDRDNAVLTKAFFKAAEYLQLGGEPLGAIVGLSEASLSRMRNATQPDIDVQSKTGQLALLFLRVFRSLDTLMGGQSDKARAWLNAHNTHLRGTPLEQMKDVRGLVHVAEYLDALRR